MQQAKLQNEKPHAPQKKRSLFETIKSRETAELVFAVCGPLGSNYKDIALEIKNELENFAYTSHIISIRELIEKNSETLRYNGEFERIKSLQDAGNSLRKKHGNSILSELAIREIAALRNDEEIYDPEANPDAQQKRIAWIIESLKNPSEVEFLRLVYGDMFYLFGVMSPEMLRINSLQKAYRISSAQASELIERDKRQDEKYEQQLSKTLHQADFFIHNLTARVEKTKDTINRFLGLILGDKTKTPTHDEYAMFIAHASSLRSGCMSRQVGACITNSDGDIISTGRNDVPKCKGGLYSCTDGNDYRCMFVNGKHCQTQRHTEHIEQDIERIIKKNTRLKDTKIEELLTLINEKTRIGSLIEFSRAVHAEMDAITSVARIGSTPLKNTKMYCTTFPCHNCARHIIASGIYELQYIEPYDKSLALDAHSDAIDFDPIDNAPEKNKKLRIIPFEGVAPNKFTKLFQAADRKLNGKLRPYSPKTATPTCAKLIDSYFSYEKKVCAHLDDILTPSANKEEEE